MTTSIPASVADLRDPRAVEAWFAAAGLSAVVVDRCPGSGCPICRPQLSHAA